MSHGRHAVVIGVGNTMRSDDGVGHRVVAELECNQSLPADVRLVHLDGEATRLIDAWRGADLALVVDAARGDAAPGTVHRFVAGVDELPAWQAGRSTHAAGIAEAVELATVLGALPDELVVYAVECGDVSMGEGLTPPVARAVPKVARRIAAEVS